MTNFVKFRTAALFPEILNLFSSWHMP